MYQGLVIAIVSMGRQRHRQHSAGDRPVSRRGFSRVSGAASWQTARWASWRLCGRFHKPLKPGTGPDQQLKPEPGTLLGSGSNWLGGLNKSCGWRWAGRGIGRSTSQLSF